MEYILDLLDLDRYCWTTMLNILHEERKEGKNTDLEDIAEEARRHGLLSPPRRWQVAEKEMRNPLMRHCTLQNGKLALTAVSTFVVRSCSL